MAEETFPILTSDSYDASPVEIQTSPAGPPWLALRVLDIAPLRTSEVDTPGAYAVLARLSGNSPWLGGSIWQSLDDDEYVGVLAISSEGMIGKSLDVLSSGPVGYWDRVNTVNIEMHTNRSLSSVSETDVLNGLNWAILGDEIIGFQNATLESDGTYTLDTLLRGLRDTEDVMSSHAINERFTLLVPGAATFLKSSLNNFGVTRYFKGAASGADLDDCKAVLHTAVCGTLRPFSPVRVSGTRDSSNNLTIEWMRRTRDLIRLFALNPTPLHEDYQSFEVDVYDGPTVVRTFSAKLTYGGPTVLYTAAQQTADGLTPGDPVNVIVYQISTKIGRGKGRSATV